MNESFSLMKLSIAGGIALIALGWFFSILISEENCQRIIAFGTILGSVVGVFGLCFIGYQAIQLRKSLDIQSSEMRLQLNRHQLESRPYLYLDIKLINNGMWRNHEEAAWFGGGDLHFKNRGKVPATILKGQYIVESDVHDSNFQEWFEEAYGGFPGPNTVFPDQNSVIVPCHPVIGGKSDFPKMFYIGAVVPYKV